MKPLHAEVARIALTLLAPDGYVLAGGYALTAQGVGSRLSEDVDLFTDADVSWRQVGHDAQRLCGTLEAAGMKASWSLMELGHPHHRIVVSRGTERTEMDLNWSLRTLAPSLCTVGPVLHLDDAATAKMRAMVNRHEARDYADVHSLILYGYTRTGLIQLARGHADFSMTSLAAALRKAAKVTPARLARYGVSPEQVAALKVEFADWSRSL